MKKLLVVDDNRAWRQSLAELLEKSGYAVDSAASAEEAMALLDDHTVDLIISDLLLPGIDGFELCRHVRNSKTLPEIPFIFCSGFFPADEQKELSQLLDVSDYFAKPVDFEKMFVAVEKALKKDSNDATKSKAGKKKEFTETHTQLVQSKLWSAVERERKERARAEKLAQRLQNNLEDFISAVAKAVEVRDPYTAGHQRRVALLACAIGEEMSLPPEVINGIHFGALIHDIGKIHIPSELLVKPSALSVIEFEMIKTHAEVGYEILKDIDSPWPIAEIAYQHHERVNGKGYPRGLKGDNIILEARIVAVADVAEAMVSHRPYRPAMGVDAAIAELTEHKGDYYDTAAVDACLRVFDKGFSFE